MLARPERNEPERREPMYPQARRDDMKVLYFCLVTAVVIWGGAIIPFADMLSRHAVEYNMARFGLQLR